MDLGIAGKVALVSGGSKGVGRACALALAAEGCKVMVVARGREAVDDTVKAIRDKGQRAEGITADMANKGDVVNAVATTGKMLGSVDIAVSNVYTSRHKSWEQTTDEDFRDTYEHMVMSIVHLFRAVEGHMKAQKW